jgi:hypothetical protein
MNCIDTRTTHLNTVHTTQRSETEKRILAYYLELYYTSYTFEALLSL